LITPVIGLLAYLSSQVRASPTLNAFPSPSSSSVIPVSVAERFDKTVTASTQPTLFSDASSSHKSAYEYWTKKVKAVTSEAADVSETVKAATSELAWNIEKSTNLVTKTLIDAGKVATRVKMLKRTDQEIIKRVPVTTVVSGVAVAVGTATLVSSISRDRKSEPTRRSSEYILGTPSIRMGSIENNMVVVKKQGMDLVVQLIQSSVSKPYVRYIFLSAAMACFVATYRPFFLAINIVPPYQFLRSAVFASEVSQQVVSTVKASIMPAIWSTVTFIGAIVESLWP